MLIVDPRDWLSEHGDLPDAPPRLRANALKVARLIEYGGPLAPGESRETLIECSKRPNRSRCPGLLWVTKRADNAIQAGCMVCKQDEILVRNWEETAWAEGPMESVRMDIGAEAQVESPPTARKRLKKPYPASLDQVRIVRNGDTAILEYAEPEVSLTHLQIGAELPRMSDQEVLDLHNRILERRQERADS